MNWIDQTAVADTSAPLEALRHVIAGSPGEDGEPTTERLAINASAIRPVYDGPLPVDDDPMPALIDHRMALRFDADAVAVPSVDGVTVRSVVEDDPRFDGDLPKPPPPTFPTAATAIAAMQAWIERAENVIDGGVSKGERDSYLAKETEARAWQADNSTTTPILSSEAAVTGEPLAELVTKVITKADALRPILGEIAGLRRATEAALLAEEAKADFDPNNLETILTGAITQAIALAGNRGITLSP
jgi:hypothetical protein